MATSLPATPHHAGHVDATVNVEHPRLMVLTLNGLRAILIHSGEPHLCPSICKIIANVMTYNSSNVFPSVLENIL